jgi:hypothetical protein
MLTERRAAMLFRRGRVGDILAPRPGVTRRAQVKPETVA